MRYLSRVVEHKRYAEIEPSVAAVIGPATGTWLRQNPVAPPIQLNAMLGAEGEFLYHRRFELELIYCTVTCKFLICLRARLVQAYERF